MAVKIRWKKIRRGIKYPVLVFLIKAFILFVRVFPRSWVLALCRPLGKAAFWLVKGERKKTIRNLTLIYGGKKSTEELRAMAQQVFVNQALNFGDYVHTLHYTTREEFARLVDVSGEEHLKKAYDQGKGVLCLMCHAGSWEFSAILPPVLGYATSALSRPMPNPRIDKLIVGYRQKRGMKNIGRGKAYPKLLESLKDGDCLIIMIDQDTQARGVFIDFMGRSAYTPVGAARLAMDSGAPVVPVFIRRKADMRHELCIQAPITWEETGKEEENLLVNTRNYTTAIEAFIRSVPDQWVWMHERWKTTPADVAAFLEKKKLKEREAAR